MCRYTCNPECGRRSGGTSLELLPQGGRRSPWQTYASTGAKRLGGHDPYSIRKANGLCFLSRRARRSGWMEQKDLSRRRGSSSWMTYFWIEVYESRSPWIVPGDANPCVLFVVTGKRKQVETGRRKALNSRTCAAGPAFRKKSSPWKVQVFRKSQDRRQ